MNDNQPLWALQDTVNSESLFDRAKRTIPGGVNSPVRAFHSVGGTPVFMQRAEGAYLYDVEGKRYIDYINSWGPMILGHGHPQVIAAIRQQAGQALTFGAPTMLEIEMAELITTMAPSVEMVRLVSSGTEACMSVLRLARGFTGRNKFIQFEGCYHGHADPFLKKAGSGMATFGIQHVPGVTKGSSEDTLVAAYNDLEQVKALLDQHRGEVAAIIIEPVAGNMGCVPPEPGFLEGLRALCDQHQALLIFDEVMTGFRLAQGGAQQRLHLRADLVTFGKVIGGGLPVGAFGGRKDIMQAIAPVGQVYQAGTLSGNPLAVTAGLTTLRWLQSHPEIYSELDQKTQQVSKGMAEIFVRKGIPHRIQSVGSMMSVFFGEAPIRNFSDAVGSQTSVFNQFFHHMLRHGVYLPPSPFESWFLTHALSDADIDYTLSITDTFSPKS